MHLPTLTPDGFITCPRTRWCERTRHNTHHRVLHISTMRLHSNMVVHLCASLWFHVPSLFHFTVLVIWFTTRLLFFLSVSLTVYQSRSAFKGLVIHVMIYAAFITHHFLLHFLFVFSLFYFVFFSLFSFFLFFSVSFSFVFCFLFTFLLLSFVFYPFLVCILFSFHFSPLSFIFCFLSFTMDASGLTPAWLSFGVLVGFSIVSYTQSRAVRATSAPSALYLFLFIFSLLVRSTSVSPCSTEYSPLYAYQPRHS